MDCKKARTLINQRIEEIESLLNAPISEETWEKIFNSKDGEEREAVDHLRDCPKCKNALELGKLGISLMKAKQEKRDWEIERLKERVTKLEEK